MAYQVIYTRRSADSETKTETGLTIHQARDVFNECVAMAVQHGEWSEVQVIAEVTERTPFPKPLMVYNNHGVDVKALNVEVDDKYSFVDSRGVQWDRPTAAAWAAMCSAYNRLRYGDGDDVQYGIKELGSDKWVFGRGDTCLFTSADREAIAWDSKQLASQALAHLVKQGEVGDFIVELLPKRS